MTDDSDLERNPGHIPHDMRESDDRTRPDSQTAQVAYETLGAMHDRIEPVLEAYQEQDLTDLESYEQLQARQARMRQMRGYVREVYIDD